MIRGDKEGTARGGAVACPLKTHLCGEEGMVSRLNFRYFIDNIMYFNLISMQFVIIPVWVKILCPLRADVIGPIV